MSSNEFDRAVDQIATFFKGAAKMQQVVKDMGMDKPQQQKSPPPGADDYESPWALAQDMYDAYDFRIIRGTDTPKTPWNSLPDDQHYGWLSAAIMAKRRIGSGL